MITNGGDPIFETILKKSGRKILGSIMKISNILFLVIAVTFISGCAQSFALVRAGSTNIRSDFFLRAESTGSRGLRDSEAGDGIRYQLTKNIRLKAGSHKIILAIIEDDIAVERDLTLAEGSRNSLVLEPIYRTVPGSRRPEANNAPSFQDGIRGLQVNLNDKPI